MMERRGTLIALVWVLAGCTPFIPVTNLNEVPAETMRDALNVKVVRIGDNGPKAAHLLGQVTGHSCKHWTWDPPPSTNDALLRMRVEAAKLRANTVMDVTCNEAGTDTFGTNCWGSVTCKGVAIIRAE
jgi:uncharacterized protein YbjQ (UPF0145 family)